MNESSDEYQVDPEFVSNLEWQLRGELSRQRRFEPPRRRRRWQKVLRTAAVIVLSLSVGFATATAAQQFEGQEQRRYLIARAQGAVELAELRMQLMEEHFDEVEERVAVGVLNEQELALVRMERMRSESEMRVSLSQLEEIELSGQEPRDDLVAPLVAGRDFVSERLEERLGVIDADRRLFREYLSRRAEAVDEHEAMAFDTQLAQFREQRQQIGRELQLRAAFLAGELEAEAVMARQQLGYAEARVKQAAEQLEATERFARQAKQRFDVGIVSSTELRVAEYELASVKLDARLARLELQMLQERAGR